MNSPNLPPEELENHSGFLRRSLSELRERLAFTLPIALLIVVAWAYHALNAIPLYMSQATLQVERPERVLITQEVVDTSVKSDLELNTYLALFSSDEIRQNVLESLSSEEWTKLSGGSESGSPDLGSLSVTAMPDTMLIRVRISHQSPESAALLSNRYIEQFISHQLQIVDQKNNDAVDYLNQRANELLLDTSAAEKRLQDYMRRNDLVSLGNTTNLTATRLNVVSNALQQARLDRIALEKQCEIIQEQSDQRSDLLKIRAISNYGAVNRYHLELEEHKRTHALLSETYLARHPKMTAVSKSITELEAAMADAIKLAIADIHASLDQAKENERSLETEYAVQEKALFRMRDLAVEFKGLESRAQVAKNSYSAILARLNETTTSKALGKVPFRSVDKARPASVPFSPNPSEIFRKATWAGVSLVIGLTILFRHFDDRIKSTHQIESSIGEHALGIINKIDEPDESARYRLVMEKREAGATEPFLGLRANVSIKSEIPTPKVIMITSTLPGEGKTVISSNLAASFAENGDRALFMDCDLRRPILHKKLELPNDRGILTWFEAGAVIEEDCLSDPLLGIREIDKNLSILTTGGHTSRPTQIFGSGALKELLEELKSQFDVIIMDTPPMGAVSDALHLSQLADESIYVARFNRASRRHIKQNTDRLRLAGCPILGIVLNGLPRRLISYYSDESYDKSYEHYYST